MNSEPNDERSDDPTVKDSADTGEDDGDLVDVHVVDTDVVDADSVDIDNEDAFDEEDAFAEGDGESVAKRARLVLVVLVALLVGILIGNLTATTSRSNEKSRSAVAPVSAAPGATTGTPTGFPAGDVDRQKYWGVIGLKTLVYDVFDRVDNPSSLGQTDTGQNWTPVAGSWGVKDKQPIRTVGTPGAPSLAVVAEGKGDGLMEVTMTTVEAGAGLVVRYRDPQNYWTVTADPSSETWSVNRVIDGESELITEFPAPTKDGTTITVTQNGPLLRFLVEAVEYFQISDPALEGQLQAGIVATGESASEARWARFLTMG